MGAGTVVENAHPLLQLRPSAARCGHRQQRRAGGPGPGDPLARLLSVRRGALPELARLVVALDEAAQPQLRYASELYLSNAFGSRSARYKAIGRDFYASLGAPTIS
jgi:hypothetical protein